MNFKDSIAKYANVEITGTFDAELDYNGIAQVGTPTGVEICYSCKECGETFDEEDALRHFAYHHIQDWIKEIGAKFRTTDVAIGFFIRSGRTPQSLLPHKKEWEGVIRELRKYCNF